MYLRVPFAPCVRHDDRNVVAGVADETVDQQTIVGVSAPNFDPTYCLT
jgi:hypothetical protein